MTKTKTKTAPPGREHSDRDRLFWLLDFLRADLDALPPGALLDLRNSVFPVLHEEQQATVTVLDDAELRALGRVRDVADSDPVVMAARRLMAGLQSQLRAGAEALQRTGIWQPFGITADHPSPHWSLERRADGTLRRLYTGTWSVITIASAADLLMEWWPQLRRCAYTTCNVLFLPDEGRQKYHDPKCSGLARWHRLPKAKRNYKQELVNANLRDKLKKISHKKKGRS